MRSVVKLGDDIHQYTISLITPQPIFFTFYTNLIQNDFILILLTMIVNTIRNIVFWYWRMIEMESVSFEWILLLLILLFFSAYFSASETALSSVNRIRLKHYADLNRRGASKAIRFSENFDQTLSTILVGNNIVNIAAAAISTKIATDLFGGTAMALFISTAVMTILILTFGEILPKSFAKEHSEQYIMTTSSFLSVTMFVLSPITWFFVRLKRGTAQLFGSKQKEPSITDEELKAMVDIGQQEGVFLEGEKKIIHSAIEFDDILVKEIINPRTDIIAIEKSMSLDEIKDVFIHEKFARIPVYDLTIDNIIGILYHRDFFAAFVNNQTFTILEIMRKPFFVIGTKKISHLLSEMQRNKVHMAIVLDEYGGTEGLVTIEDIVEEIVGEIFDEHDENVTLYEEIEEDEFLYDAIISIEQFARSLDIELPESAAQTLGGFIIELLGRYPKLHDEVTYHNLRFEVSQVDKRRIKKIRVQRLSPV